MADQAECFAPEHAVAGIAPEIVKKPGKEERDNDADQKGLTRAIFVEGFFVEKTDKDAEGEGSCEDKEYFTQHFEEDSGVHWSVWLKEVR